MRRKIIETFPESYTITIPEYGYNMLINSTYVPKATGEVDNANGSTISAAYGFSVYFNPYKDALTNDATSILPKHPVNISFRFLKEGEVVYSNSIVPKTKVTNGRPYAGFVLFRDLEIYENVDLGKSSYITDYDFGVDTSKWETYTLDLEITISSQIEVPIACIVTPLQTRYKKPSSSSGSTKETESEYQVYTSSKSASNEKSNIKDCVQLNRNIEFTDSGMTTFGFNHIGIRYLEDFDWWGD